MRCDDILPGACDCDGNVVDECGVCGGPGAIYEWVATTSFQALAIAMGTLLMSAVFAVVLERFMNVVATTSFQALAIATGMWLTNAACVAVGRFIVRAMTSSRRLRLRRERG